MPYINQELRAAIDPAIEALIDDIRARIEVKDYDGVLNYTISRVVTEVIRDKGGWRYRMIAQVMAVFQCAAAEFYRRVGGPREDAAIRENGDIPAYET